MYWHWVTTKEKGYSNNKLNSLTVKEYYYQMFLVVADVLVSISLLIYYSHILKSSGTFKWVFPYLLVTSKQPCESEYIFI